MTHPRRSPLHRIFPAVLPLCACAVLPHASANEWTRFRGPNGTGISKAKGIPTRFTRDDYNWKVELPGVGHAQPVIWESKIFVTAAPRDGTARHLLCLNTEDGSLLWEQKYPTKWYNTHKRTNHAASTPTVDGDRVYFALVDGAEAFVIALDHGGDEKWRRSLGEFRSKHGIGASLMLFEDLVIVPKEHLRRESDPEMTGAIYALERATGEIRWQTPRKGDVVAYSTPRVYEGEKGRPELLFTSSATGIYSMEARTGKPLWQADVFTMRTVSSPIVAGGLVFGTCGSGGGGNYVVAVRPGGRGDVGETHELYRIKRDAIPYVPCPVGLGNRLYLWGDSGIGTCLKASTGEIIWHERIGGNYSGSPVWIDGRLFSISDRGDVVVIAATDKLEVLARNPLGEPSRSTPAVAGGRLYLRTYSHLISVGGKKAAKNRVETR